MPRKENIDIAILVPKDDELNAFKVAFDIELEKSDGELNAGKLYYKFNFQMESQDTTLSLVVILLNDQGNNISSSITEQILSTFNPTITILVGTAAGCEEKIEIGDVVISSLVIDFSEWRYEEQQTPRTKQHIPPEKISVDLKRFLNEKFEKVDFISASKLKLEELYEYEEIIEKFSSPETKVEVKAIASSNILYLNRDLLQIVWENDDRLRCIDMESGGFGGVCKASSGIQWLVIRGISDFGTPQSKKENYRLAASINACIFLKMFLENGLKETHPRWIKIPESDETILSEENFYSKYDVISFLKEEIHKRIGVDLSNIEITNTISFADLESICRGRSEDAESHYEILSEIREKYFTDKYLSYNYENDLRGLIPYWAQEFNTILRLLTIDLSNSIIIDIGISNGLEVEYLFQNVKKLIGVDVSQQMLDKVQEKFPWISIIHNPAEKLTDVKTNYVDVYISLRTYQSSLLDIPQALREMQRVLKPGGIVILSIANGFIQIENSEKKIIRGLLIPGTKNHVDKNLSLKIGERILIKLNQMGFEQTGIKSEKTDVYVWGRKP